jgi:hemoglobin
VLHIHSGNGDMSDLGRRFVACFVAAMDDVGMPDDPEFRESMRVYMEHAVAEVLTYESPDAAVPSELPMPRWTWNGPAACET